MIPLPLPLPLPQTQYYYGVQYSSTLSAVVQQRYRHPTIDCVIASLHHCLMASSNSLAGTPWRDWVCCDSARGT
ncbi:hypothetical protein EYC84_010041 [Monilinia fructicola]|uniref:Uncharacterized protein n=1 Tax=Monilinia fructicola TaxID=38448 RepID=A0A5M9JIK5_MONFR|nr:hypothetical protein EYC84_010041 [Monilinia fructicola]